MKKISILLIILCTILFIGCGNKEKTNAEETYLISGTIENKECIYYTTNLVIKTDDGIKFPIYEMHSSFSDGLCKGDRVCFEVKKVNGSGYMIVGLGLDNRD